MSDMMRPSTDEMRLADLVAERLRASSPVEHTLFVRGPTHAELVEGIAMGVANVLAPAETTCWGGTQRHLPDDLLKAVREGVRDALLQVLDKATLTSLLEHVRRCDTGADK